METNGIKEGGGTERGGWVPGVLCFFSWNAALGPSAAAQEQESREIVLRKAEALHSCFGFSPPFFLWPWLFGAIGGHGRGGVAAGGKVREGRENSEEDQPLHTSFLLIIFDG